MRKSFLLNFFLLSTLAATVFTSCKDDGELTAFPIVSNQSFVEEFDTAAAALSRGWKFINTSDPRGAGVWQDGGEVNPWFQAFSNNGSKAGFIGTDYTSTSAASASISNWLVSPAVMMQNGDKITFYTRALQYSNGAGDSTDYGNSLRVCVNTSGDNLVVGTGAEMGAFVSLYDINPNMAYSSKNSPSADAYPTRWTRFEVTVNGLTTPMKSRFAFKYYVPNGGSNGNGSGVAIDKVIYTSVNK